mgnify:CR=1 FL=1
MAELTPLQIVRNMAKDILFKRSKGVPQFEKEPLEFRQVDVEKNPELVALEDEILLNTFDPTTKDAPFLRLERYESDSAGKQIADAFGMRVPGVSLFANAAKAYGHGIAMNKHREFIKNYVKEKMVKEGYTVDSYGNLNTEEARNELRKRMPEITDSNAFREFSEGALAAIPVAKGSFGVLKALYNKIPKDTPESIKLETGSIEGLPQ